MRNPNMRMVEEEEIPPVTLEVAEYERKDSKEEGLKSIGSTDLEVLEEELGPEYISREHIFFRVIFMNQFFPGIPLGVFQGSLPIILLKKGCSLVDLGHLTITNYPMGLKFLYGPFLDRYYSNRIGKRMTYLIPCLYAFGIISLFYSFFAEEWTSGLKTIPISIVGFLLMLIAGITMVSTDGYLVSIIQKSKRSYMPMIKLISQNLGVFAAYNLFILLNSPEFCNQYLFTIKRDTPLLDYNTFFLIVGVMALVYVVIIHLFLYKEPHSEKSFGSLEEILKVASGFWKNKNLLYCLVFLLFWRVGFCVIDAYFIPGCIRGGFARESFIYIQTLLLPFSIITTVMFGRYATKSKSNIFVLFYLFLVLKTIVSVIQYYFLTKYETPEQWKGAFWPLTGVLALDTLQINCYFVAIGAFFARTCDVRIGSTYITVTMSLANFGKLWPETLMYYIMKEATWEILQICCWAIGAVFMWFTVRIAKRLEALDWKDFELDAHTN